LGLRNHAALTIQIDGQHVLASQDVFVDIDDGERCRLLISFFQEYQFFLKLLKNTLVRDVVEVASRSLFVFDFLRVLRLNVLLFFLADKLHLISTLHVTDVYSRSFPSIGVKPRNS
jgi:hypothetical protein